MRELVDNHRVMCNNEYMGTNANTATADLIEAYRLEIFAYHTTEDYTSYETACRLANSIAENGDDLAAEFFARLQGQFDADAIDARNAR